MGRHNGFRLAGKAALLLFFLVFFVYPLARVLLYAFSSAESAGGLSYILQVIWESRALLWNSFSQSLVSTMLSVLIGVPAAFLMAHRKFPFKRAINALSLIPFVFPSILVVLSFVLVFGNNGWVNNFLSSLLGQHFQIQFLYGFFGIVLAHVFYNFPLVMRFVSSAWKNVDFAMEDTARTLGATKADVFLKITLPQLLPSILASASLVFIYCFMSFAIVLSLGGLKFSTFEVEIYRQISRSLDFGTGATLAFFQFALLLVFSMLYLHVSSKNKIRRGQIIASPSLLSIRHPRGAAEVLFLISIIAFILLPLFSLVVFAFRDPSTGGFSLRAFEFILFSGPSLSGTTPLHAIFYSLLLGFAAACISTLAGLVASLQEKRFGLVELLMGSSIAVSVITLALGYYLSFGPGSLLIIALGHSVLSFPFAYRLLSEAVSKIEPESIEAARTLGAGKFGIFRKIQFPGIKDSFFASLAFGFAVSLGELGFVLVLSEGVYATMPVYIYRLLSTFNLFAATAMGLILIAVSFACFYAIERFSKNPEVL